MDIFTTQLTRVVQIPIKPANLKVKALLKEAGTSKLKEDHDHLENHDYYFIKKKPDNKANQEHEAENKNEIESKPVERLVDTTDDMSNECEPKLESTSTEEVKHLDLYV
jgi:hypothetical protein